ncbi:MAG: rhamnose/proton symporter RhaT [Bacteroidetes bacterium]|nr:rhamnose/proton symporter RhaT [Bacteroidota bacterium]
MNVIIGLSMLILGGVSAGSCYTPFRKVQGWSWESLWTVQGIVAWLLLPLLLALLATPHLWEVLGAVPSSTLFYTYLFGFLWGIGGLAWGIAVRYVGISLGFTIATGFLSSLGTLVPIVVAGQMGEVLSTKAGRVTMVSVLISLVGLVICGSAGILRDREKVKGGHRPTDNEQPDTAGQQQTDNGQRFRQGVFIAFLAGVLAACFAFGIQTGSPIRERAIELGASPVWATSPVFFVELLGGITLNLGYCIWMHLRNRSFGDYIRPAAPAGASALAGNYAWSSLAGTLWYLQFLFYGMAAYYMGKYSFTNWSIHMSFMVVAGNLWGFYYKEWAGVSPRTFRRNIIGIVVLVASGIVMGVASYIKTN